MANTYSKIYLHIVFAVKNRCAQISQSWEKRLYSYIGAALKSRGHISLAINGTHDHIHILLIYSITDSIPEMVKSIKINTTRWINREHLAKGEFSWQKGYGVFSYSQSSIDSVIKYIMSQKEHHLKRNMVDEYKEMLTRYNVEFSEEYVFD